MAAYDLIKMQELFASKIAEIIPEEVHTKLFTELGISAVIVEAYRDEKPTIKAQILLKIFMDKEKFQSFDILLSALDNIAQADDSAKVKRIVQETIAEYLSKIDDEKFWEHLGIDKFTIGALKYLPESKKNAELIKIWRKDQAHTIATLLVAITEFTSSSEQIEENPDKPVAESSSGSEQVEQTTDKPVAECKAIPLCYPDNCVWNKADGTLTERMGIPRKKFLLNEEALSLIESIDHPVCLVSIAGESCTGKSYILNQLQDDVVKRNIFNVLPTLKGCTRGLWMSAEPFMRKMADGTEVAVILIDSEGLDSLEASQTEILFALTILISSLLIYNCKDLTKPASSIKLRYFDTLASKIQVHKEGYQIKADSAHFYKFFPDLLWLLRDVTSPLAIGTKKQLKEVDAKDYILLEILNANECGSSAMAKKEIKLKNDIIHYFPVFDGLTLPVPSSQSAIIRQLHGLKNIKREKELNREFVKGIETLRHKVNSMIKPKKIWPKVGNMHGPHLATLLQVCISQINSGGTIPCIQPLWEDVIKSLLDPILNKAIAVYEADFDSVSSEERPCKEVDILAKHCDAMDKITDLYSRETRHINDASLRMEYFRKLQDIIIVFERESQTISGGLLFRAIADNEAASDLFCRRVADEALHRLTRPPYHGDEKIKVHERTKKMICDTISDYNARARGPKIIKVRQEYLVKKIEETLLPDKLVSEKGYRSKQMEKKRYSDKHRQEKTKMIQEYLMREGAQTLEEWKRNAMKEEEKLQDERLSLIRCEIDRQEKAWDSFIKQQKHLQRIDDEEIRYKQEQDLVNRKRVSEHKIAILEEEQQERETDIETLVKNKRRARDRDVAQLSGSVEEKNETHVASSKDADHEKHLVPTSDQDKLIFGSNLVAGSQGLPVGAEQVHPMFAWMEHLMKKDDDRFKMLNEVHRENAARYDKMITEKDKQTKFESQEGRRALEEAHKLHTGAMLRVAEMRKEESAKNAETLLVMQKESEEKEMILRDQHRLELKVREDRAKEEKQRREETERVMLRKEREKDLEIERARSQQSEIARDLDRERERRERLERERREQCNIS